VTNDERPRQLYLGHPHSIDVDEVAHHIEILERIVTSSDPDERQRFLIEGLARFGVRFNATLGMAHERFPGLRDDFVTAAKRWLSLEPILGWADESERRAHFAIETIDQGQDGLLRLAARALLAVPATSPNRDEARARHALLRHLELGEIADDPDQQVTAIDELVGHDLVNEATAIELLARADRLLDRTDMETVGRDFLVEVLGFNLRRAIRARDAGDDAGRTSARQAAEAAHERLSQIPGDAEEQIKRVMLLAPVIEVAGDSERAADLYGRVRLDPHASPSTAAMCARHEARLRLDLDQDARVIDALAPFMNALADEYLSAVEESEIRSTGEAFADSSAILAFAQARSGSLEDAVRTLEQSKSLRLRHQIAVRRHSAGAQALVLERELHALTRGVEAGTVHRTVDSKSDPVAAATSLHARILEEYRRVREALAPTTMAAPSVATIAAALDVGEVAVLLAVGFKGTLAIIVDATAAATAIVLPEATLQRLRDCMVDGERGWAIALEAGESVLDPRPELDRLLEYVDASLGRPLAAALASAPVRRLIVVPHRLYELVPFWAMPSLTTVEVVVAPSAAHIYAGSARPPRKIRHALLVADPTLDLPLAALEQESARARFEQIGIECTSILRENATEANVGAAAAGAQLLHFAGHGKANLTQPVQSTLLMHPDPALGAMDADGLAALAAKATAWNEVDEENRWTTIAGVGRLSEARDLVLDRLERSLDYGESGTLCAFYQGDQLTQLAELWTAGDMMVDGALADCEMAVLSACASGAGAIGNCEERGGLPGALMLAGVPLIVATAWPVSEEMTTLFIDALYEKLSGSGGPCDLAAAVNDTRQLLRDMPRDTAAARLAALGSPADLATAFERDVAVERLRAGDPFPFRHPFEWASFHVLGRGAVDLGLERSRT
jgi:CHAT domain-containing protein